MKQTADKLRAAALEILRTEKTVEKAAPKLARDLMENSARPMLVALVTDYLNRIIGMPAPGPMPASRRREGAHRRGPLGTPTAIQKSGALIASTQVASEIFKRKIRGCGPLGNIRVHELRAIAQNQAAVAGKFTQRGYDDAVDAIAFATISNYCVASDPFAKVEDVIPAKVAVQAWNDAAIRAAQIISDAAVQLEQKLLKKSDETPKPIRRRRGDESPPL